MRKSRKEESQTRVLARALAVEELSSVAGTNVVCTTREADGTKDITDTNSGDTCPPDPPSV